MMSEKKKERVLARGWMVSSHNRLADRYVYKTKSAVIRLIGPPLFKHILEPVRVKVVEE